MVTYTVCASLWNWSRSFCFLRSKYWPYHTPEHTCISHATNKGPLGARLLAPHARLGALWREMLAVVSSRVAVIRGTRSTERTT